jgi:hypothetical protein
MSRELFCGDDGRLSDRMTEEELNINAEPVRFNLTKILEKMRKNLTINQLERRREIDSNLL